MTYVIVVNQEGYLPEGEPDNASDIEDALSLLMCALEATAGAYGLDGTPEAQDAYEEVARLADEPDPTDTPIHLGGYAHTIMRADAFT